MKNSGPTHNITHTFGDSSPHKIAGWFTFVVIVTLLFCALASFAHAQVSNVKPTFKTLKVVGSGSISQGYEVVTNSDLNKVFGTRAQAEDTSAVFSNITGTGKPVWRVVNQTGVPWSTVDSSGQLILSDLPYINLQSGAGALDVVGTRAEVNWHKRNATNPQNLSANAAGDQWKAYSDDAAPHNNIATWSLSTGATGDVMNVDLNGNVYWPVASRFIIGGTGFSLGTAPKFYVINGDVLARDGTAITYSNQGAGTISTMGAGAAFFFFDRANFNMTSGTAGNKWGWYSTAQIARLFTVTKGDVMKVTAAGAVQIPFGPLDFPNTGGSITFLNGGVVTEGAVAGEVAVTALDVAGDGSDATITTTSDNLRITNTGGTHVDILSTGVVDLSKFSVGASAVMTKIFADGVALDFPNTLTLTSSDLTITIGGAVDGDIISLGVPNVSVNANSCYTAWVSAANTVTVRFNNYSAGAINPASGTFRVSVTEFL